MADIIALTKKVSDTVTIYPFKEVEKWPVYLNEETGEEEQLSDGWKDVGFICNYPTVERLRVVAELSGKAMSLSGGGLRVTGTSLNEYIQFLCDSVICGVTGVERSGEPINYKVEKQWFVTQFKNSRFLLDNTTYEYRSKAESWKEDDEDGKKNIEGKPDSSSPTDQTTNVTEGESPGA